MGTFENGGFPTLGVLFSGVPIMRIIVYWSLSWGPPDFGNYQFSNMSRNLNS